MVSKLWILFEVKGVNFDGRDKYIRRHVNDADMVLLVKEPENPFDRDAVLVRHKRIGLGYVPKELSGLVSDALRKDKCRKKVEVALVSKEEPFVLVLISITPNPLKFMGVEVIYG